MTLTREEMISMAVRKVMPGAIAAMKNWNKGAHPVTDHEVLDNAEIFKPRIRSEFNRIAKEQGL